MKPPLVLSLQMADARHRELLPRHQVAQWIRAALDGPAQVTVRCVDRHEARALNLAYRHRDYAADVLTFEYDPTPGVCADIVLCTEVVEQDARQLRRDLKAHYVHLIVHGTLHAQGMDHQRLVDEKRMRLRESQVMQALGYPDPWAPQPTRRGEGVSPRSPVRSSSRQLSPANAKARPRTLRR